MVLSNTERQARYRNRLKQLATRGALSPVQLEILTEARYKLREQRRLRLSYEFGLGQFMFNGVDRTSDQIAMVESQIDQYERLLSRFDPDNQTADENLEIGAASQCEWAEVRAGRWVSFVLDSHGRATDLRAYDVESMARTDARQRDGRHGKVAADGWSIEPAPWHTAYALMQEMPNGWWKACISGWSDLPEQIEPSEDHVISAIGAVAREYLRERLNGGIPVPASYQVALLGWTCIPVSIDL